MQLRGELPEKKPKRGKKKRKNCGGHMEALKLSGHQRCWYVAYNVSEIQLMSTKAATADVQELNVQYNKYCIICKCCSFQLNDFTEVKSNSIRENSYSNQFFCFAFVLVSNAHADHCWRITLTPWPSTSHSLGTSTSLSLSVNLWISTWQSSAHGIVVRVIW